MQRIDSHIRFAQIAGISPFNVRQADPADDRSGLKATIRAVGVVNRLTLHPTLEDAGRYLVLAGGRRWLTIADIRAEDPDFMDDLDVSIVQDASEGELRALSMMENVSQLAMHPVRQYEAFAAIAHAYPAREQAIDVIAKEFGLTRQTVRQRLALGDLSPKVRAAWLAGEIGAEAAKAYAEADSIEAQEAFFETAGAMRVGAAYEIRKALLSDWIDGDEAAFLFVGEKAYLAAGGIIKDSLFAEERRYSKSLLEKLAHEKLVQEGQKICAAELWGKYVIAGDANAADFARDARFHADLLPAEKERSFEIDERLEEIEYERGPEFIQERRDLQKEADDLMSLAFKRGVKTKDRLALAIELDYDEHGCLSVTRAVAPKVQPAAKAEADESAASPRERPEGPGQAATPPQAPLPPSEPIGKALRTVLDETVSHAMAAAATRNGNVAIALMVATLGCGYGNPMLLDVRIHTRRNWTPAHELLQRIKPLRFEQALRIAVESPLGDLTVCLFELVGAAIDTARCEKIEPGLDMLNAVAQIANIKSDLQDQFDRNLYFNAATKAAAVAAIREIDGEAAAAEAQKLGKAELKARAIHLAEARKWLPAVLLDALEQAAPVLASEEKPSIPDARTTIQAMQDAIEADSAEAEDEETDPNSPQSLVARFFAAHVETAKGQSVDVVDLDNWFYAFNKALGARILGAREVREAVAARGVAISRVGKDEVFSDIALINRSKLPALETATHAQAEDDSGPEPQTDVDRVNQFIIARCDIGIHAKTVKGSVLGFAYDAYAEERGWPAISGNKLAKALDVIGVEKHRLGKGIHYKNLSLRENAATPSAAEA